MMIATKTLFFTLSGVYGIFYSVSFFSKFADDRFTSGATPADLLAASMAVEPFLICILALVGLKPRIECDTNDMRIR